MKQLFRSFGMLSAIFFANLVFANPLLDGVKVSSLDDMSSANMPDGQSPFQILKQHFESANLAIKLTDLDKYNAKATYSCVVVAHDEPYVVKDIDLVALPVTKPAVPGKGPLLPGEPSDTVTTPFLGARNERHDNMYEYLTTEFRSYVLNAVFSYPDFIHVLSVKRSKNFFGFKWDSAAQNGSIERNRYGYCWR